MAVITGMEKRLFDKKDFVRTENYNIRIRPDGVRKLIGLFDARFTSKTSYQGKNWEWGYVIASKTGELARFIEDNRKTIDFANPSPDLKRDDSEAMRSHILDLSYAEWKKSGFSKGTLHELKKKARSDEPFKIYSNVKEKLAARH